MGEGGPATVLLVDDHPLVRQGLGALLGLEPWVERVV
jgi:DNA-binding NarL/FixJ family response regulator